MKLPSTGELIEFLNKHGVFVPTGGRTPDIKEAQRSYIEFKREQRDARLWIVALASAIAAIISAVAAMIAVLAD